MLSYLQIPKKHCGPQKTPSWVTCGPQAACLRPLLYAMWNLRTCEVSDFVWVFRPYQMFFSIKCLIFRYQAQSK